jgi:hypothetical protein
MGGIGLVALIYRLGAWLFRPTGGVVAAFMATVNPFQIYYSQETRSYVWVTFWGAVAVAAAWRLWRAGTHVEGVKSRNLWFAAYVGATVSGLYTHYLFPLVMAAPLILGTAAIIRTRSWLRLRQWVLAHMLVALLFAPWTPVALRQVLGWPATADQYSWGSVLADVWRLLTLGTTISTADSTVGLLGFAFLAAIGLLPLGIWTHRERDGAGSFSGWLLVVSWCLVPIALVLALNLYKPAFAKFLLVASPALCLIFGRGAAAWFPTGPSVDGKGGLRLLFPLALSLGLTLSFTAESLDNLYNNPTYARADYRGIAQYLDSIARPGDAVILNAPNQWEVFTYYYPHLDRTYPLPRSRPAIEAELTADLEQIAGSHGRVFALLWAEAESDPQHLVEKWLDAHAFKADDQWWGDVRLVIYSVPVSATNHLQTPLQARLGDSILLHGYTIEPDRFSPGDIIQVSLFWETLTPVNERYKVFLHLLAADGALLSQRDSEPGGGLALTTTWQPGQTVTDRHGLLIPGGALSGQYRLIAGLYPVGDPNTRLLVTIDDVPVGDSIPLSTILIAVQD